ncbi:terminase [Pseudomonas aeruginosa]|nr:terminase [Pseudomonas aeruginosa]
MLGKARAAHPGLPTAKPRNKTAELVRHGQELRLGHVKRRHRGPSHR